MFWSKSDIRVIYEIDSGMTNMIEGILNAEEEKILLNMGMEWIGSTDFDETDTHPPMQLTVGLFYYKSNEVRRIKESVGLEDKHISQVLNAYADEYHIQE